MLGHTFERALRHKRVRSLRPADGYSYGAARHSDIGIQPKSHQTNRPQGGCDVVMVPFGAGSQVFEWHRHRQTTPEGATMPEPFSWSQ